MQNRHTHDLHVVRGHELVGRSRFVVWQRWNVSVFTALIRPREETRQVPTARPLRSFTGFPNVFVLRALNETMHSGWHRPGKMPSLLLHLEDYFVSLFTPPPITYGTVGAKHLSTNRFYPSAPQAHIDEENRGVENAAFLLICSETIRLSSAAKTSSLSSLGKFFRTKILRSWYGTILPTGTWLEKGLKKKTTERKSGGRKAGRVVLIRGLFIWASIILLG